MMGAVKTMREKMADEGLRSYIVTYVYADDYDSDEHYEMQFWAEDEAHACEQMEDAEPGSGVNNVRLVDTDSGM
jgi:hypothetical protein